MSLEPFLGEVMPFAGNFNPRGWLRCEGQLLSIAQYNALFAVIGTAYGGDGVSTFGLPDLRGRVPVGMGQGPGLSSYSMGQKGGVESVTLTTSQMPTHTHPLQATSTGQTDNPSGARFAVAAASAPVNSVATYAASANTTTRSAGSSVYGSGNAHTNIQPSLAIMYCIAVEGVFPSRQ